MASTFRARRLMHEFSRRLEQLLATFPDLSAGHRERLSRSVRQTDTHCWPPPESADLEACLKASLRTAGHELWDQFALQVEAGLVACRNPASQVLALGLCVRALVRGASVWFALPGTWAGWSFPASECLVVEPAGATADDSLALLVHHYRRTGSTMQIAAGRDLARRLDITSSTADFATASGGPTLCLPGRDAERTQTVRVMFISDTPANNTTRDDMTSLEVPAGDTAAHEVHLRQMFLRPSAVERDPFACVANICRPWGW